MTVAHSAVADEAPDAASRRQWGLRRRILLIFAVGAFLLSLLLAVIAYGFARASLIDQREATARDITRNNAGLVANALRGDPSNARQALELLQGYGMDHVAEFPMILGEILNRLSVQGNYAPSQTLQTMRLLKRYQFIRRQQLEMIFTGPPAEYPPRTAPHRPGDDDD